METAIHLDNITLRKELLPGDLGYIAYMHGKQYAHELGYGLNFEGYVLEGLQEFARKYDTVKDRVWICEHNNQIIGCMIGFHRGQSVQLRYLIFLPEYRGVGLGKKLMNEFMAYMRELGYKKAYLWTTNEQHAAIFLYTKYGFRLTEEKVSHAFDKALTELRYDLVLPEA
ncbi:GNAT family N-acetyltransferase [Mucilaginibacter sabulilitoris]|uniref:GNAT family N-acetyltransferase n=1 Tax=Mucilaginibacter sabulilitoris TaxID=1173583 RepID=A0ABZ0TS96_9SPHI|nr:GNAT family N-acetyltransferase [Mucilaginibacter sabulilitoris]WPU95018.1 GNAT family N-acetyltransferase [Mucilaginibacter sabulilitoris]